MLLLHLCDLLGVLLVHLLQFPHHAFAALAQSLFVTDQLKEDGACLRPQGGHGVTPLERGLCVCSYLVDEGEVSLDGGFILFLLELEVPAQLLLGLLHVSHRQLPLLGLKDRGGHEEAGSVNSLPVPLNLGSRASSSTHQCCLQYVDGTFLLLQLQLDSHHGAADLGSSGRRLLHTNQLLF